MVFRITTDRCRYCGRCFETVLYHERDSCPLRPRQVKTAWCSFAWWLAKHRSTCARKRQEARDAS